MVQPRRAAQLGLRWEDLAETSKAVFETANLKIHQPDGQVAQTICGAPLVNVIYTDEGISQVTCKRCQQIYAKGKNG